MTTEERLSLIDKLSQDLLSVQTEAQAAELQARQRCEEKIRKNAVEIKDLIRIAEILKERGIKHQYNARKVVPDTIGFLSLYKSNKIYLGMYTGNPKTAQLVFYTDGELISATKNFQVVEPPTNIMQSFLNNFRMFSDGFYAWLDTELKGL